MNYLVLHAEGYCISNGPKEGGRYNWPTLCEHVIILPLDVDDMHDEDIEIQPDLCEECKVVWIAAQGVDLARSMK